MNESLSSIKGDLADRTTDDAFRRFSNERVARWDQIAKNPPSFDGSRYYHRRLVTLYRSMVPPGSSVIEFGCGNGDLLAALTPEVGVGLDFSTEMIALARERHPELEIHHVDVHGVEVDRTFDFVILSDLLNEVWDVESVLEHVVSVSRPDTRIIINFYSRLWQGPLSVARSMGLARPVLRQNWLSVKDVENLLRLSGLEIVSRASEILLPMSMPLVSTALNRFVVKFWPFNRLAFTHFLVARRVPDQTRSVEDDTSVSIVIPARNEAGHIDEILDRTPRMGLFTELIFVEGNSTDGTFEVIAKAISERPEANAALYQQSGVGKGDAVRLGFEKASGDILMILDADMTVAPEDLPRFFRVIASGNGEFANGVRLIYPMEKQAMRFLNYLGNRFFGAVFSWLLRQPVKDTLCGTKVLTRTAYESISSGRSYFGDFDPFGDFDLLFGASRNNLKIVDVPIRYRERRYGTTNIDRWRHGALLIRMAAFAARRLRFI